MARLASNSAATSAPPIMCTGLPSASHSACKARLGSWPAQITTLSTGRISSAPLRRICRPSESILRYSTPPSMFTPLYFNTVRCIQPVVLPKLRPTMPSLRCNSQISRSEGGSCGSLDNKAPRRAMLASICHSSRNKSGDKALSSPCWLRYSAVSKPMPPAPIIATRLPTGFLSRNTSK